MRAATRRRRRAGNDRIRKDRSRAGDLFADGPADLRLDRARPFEPISLALPDRRAAPALRSQRVRSPPRRRRRHRLFPRQGHVARCQASDHAARSQSQLPDNGLPAHPQVFAAGSPGERPRAAPASRALPVHRALLPPALSSRHDGREGRRVRPPLAARLWLPACILRRAIEALHARPATASAYSRRREIESRCRVHKARLGCEIGRGHV